MARSTVSSTEKDKTIADEVTDEKEEALIENSDIKPVDPIAAAVDKLILRVTDIRFSVVTFISHAAKWQIDQLKKHSKEIKKFGKILDQEDPATEAYASKCLMIAFSNYERIEKSEIVQTLEIGHFLSLFSAYDAFTGDLLSAIYTKNPELFRGINRSMAISEMLNYGNMEDIKYIILQNEIESFRRKSYIEQFETLESRFKLTLRKFDNWPDFVECSQRRNLLTHCDGIISDQYLQLCNSEGCKLKEKVKVGDKLGLSPSYLINSCHLIIEIALKLAQTLWRDQFKDEIEKADEHLQVTQYDFLRLNNISLALMAGKFAVGLPRYSGETLKTIMFVNYIIAVKFSEDKDNVLNLLNSKDWSPLCNDFKLAEAVLRDDFTTAATIMIKIGTNGDFISEEGYHDWPLFRFFRETTEFSEAYKAVYGHAFVKELRKAASKTEDAAAEDIKKIEKELEDTSTNICSHEVQTGGSSP